MPGDPFSIKKLVRIKNFHQAEFRRKIRVHKESHDPENPRDLIDIYITQMNEEQKQNPNSTFSGTIVTCNQKEVAPNRRGLY